LYVARMTLTCSSETALPHFISHILIE
jgi:hypothetical protein